mmetsp:Transcript_156432/g.501901  ORF Transcript_156432/g.501901 Transcript_156432/m.501901 type:complete len:363 (-) Transcript_156432:1263-2351(-)
MASRQLTQQALVLKLAGHEDLSWPRALVAVNARILSFDGHPRVLPQDLLLFDGVGLFVSKSFLLLGLFGLRPCAGNGLLPALPACADLGRRLAQGLEQLRGEPSPVVVAGLLEQRQGVVGGGRGKLGVLQRGVAIRDGLQRDGLPAEISILLGEVERPHGGRQRAGEEIHAPREQASGGGSVPGRGRGPPGAERLEGARGLLREAQSFGTRDVHLRDGQARASLREAPTQLARQLDRPRSNVQGLRKKAPLCQHQIEMLGQRQLPLLVADLFRDADGILHNFECVLLCSVDHVSLGDQGKCSTTALPVAKSMAPCKQLFGGRHRPQRIPIQQLSNRESVKRALGYPRVARSIRERKSLFCGL